jgi:DNA-binding NarL/FixJ family response regulator
VIVADDSGLYRDLLVHTLISHGHLVIGQASSAGELTALADATPPDLVLSDIRMPPTHTDDGLRAVVDLRARHPGLGVILLSMYGEIEYAVALAQQLQERAGYLLKERATGATELLDTMDRVAAGGLVIDPDIVARLMSRPRADNPLQRLSERELEALRLMAEGLGNGAIAGRMRVTISTVEKHVTALLRKLDLRSDPPGPATGDNARVRAVLAYLRHTGRLPGEQ